MTKLSDVEAVATATLLGAEFSKGRYWHAWIEEQEVSCFSYETKADVARAIIDRVLEKHRTLT
jgi:hypothetical protein